VRWRKARVRAVVGKFDLDIEPMKQFPAKGKADRG
jgi:hypothetical protein